MHPSESSSNIMRKGAYLPLIWTGSPWRPGDITYGQPEPSWCMKLSCLTLDGPQHDLWPWGKHQTLDLCVWSLKQGYTSDLEGDSSSLYSGGSPGLWGEWAATVFTASPTAHNALPFLRPSSPGARRKVLDWTPLWITSYHFSAAIWWDEK